MSEILDEQLSALLDGELAAEEIELVLARLDRDPDLQARFGRYAMIGECVRSGAVSPEALSVAARVRQALDDPGAARSPMTPVRARRPARWLAASAACAALAAVLISMPGLWQPAPPAGLPAAPLIATVVDDVAPVRQPVRSRPPPQSAARLTTYLVAHGSYASPLARSSLDSHLVSARMERASWSQAQDFRDAR
jgi:negative regulator of sigma E activity